MLNKILWDSTEVEFISGGRGSGKSWLVIDKVMKYLEQNNKLGNVYIQSSNYNNSKSLWNYFNYRLTVKKIEYTKNEAALTIRLDNTTIRFITPAVECRGCICDYLLVDDLDKKIANFSHLFNCKGILFTHTPEPVPNQLVLQILSHERTKIKRLSTLDNIYLSQDMFTRCEELKIQNPLLYVTQVLGHVLAL